MAARDENAYVVVFTTLPSVDEGRRFVRGLVEDRVAACGTVLPGATSVYWWQGKIEETSEVQVVLKTRRERWTELERAVQERHPYDVPELLAMPVEAGLSAYLDWINAEPSDGTPP
ncbi:MAG: divalent-cation tolerance protein CutA [Gemmatimonadales bacterium]